MQFAVTIAIIASLLTCYFAAVQVALKSFSRRKLEELILSKRRAKGESSPLQTLSERIPKFMMVTGILRTIFTMLILFSVLYIIQEDLPRESAQLQYSLAFVIGGLCIILFNVVIPASWGRYQPEWILSKSLPILKALQFLFSPILMLLSIFDPIVRRISGADIDKDTDSEIADEVLSTIEEHDESDTVDEEQKEMLEAILEISDTDAGEVMTPRTDVHGLSLDSTLQQIKDFILEHGHSRIPVYDDNLDNIQGILYAKDLIQFVGDGKDFNLASVLREPFMIPETKSVQDLLAEFKEQKIHLAIVVDEYGGTAGIVTVEDIVEEIVGEIQDEYELQEEPEQIRRIDEDTADIDARTHIDDINDEFGIELPEDEDYDTLGGFVFAELGHIPTIAEQFEQAAA